MCEVYAQRWFSVASARADGRQNRDIKMQGIQVVNTFGFELYAPFAVVMLLRDSAVTKMQSWQGEFRERNRSLFGGGSRSSSGDHASLHSCNLVNGTNAAAKEKKILVRSQVEHLQSTALGFQRHK
jgi:hypothetical protein